MSRRRYIRDLWYIDRSRRRKNNSTTKAEVQTAREARRTAKKPIKQTDTDREKDRVINLHMAVKNSYQQSQCRRKRYTCMRVNRYLCQRMSVYRCAELSHDADVNTDVLADVEADHFDLCEKYGEQTNA